MRVIAHRGLADDVPENTLAAVEAALTAGADGLEVDVRASADGVAVCCHDGDLLRVARRPLIVAQEDAARLCAVDLGVGQRIPRLADVLALTSGRTELVLDVKAEGTGPGRDAAALATCRELQRLRSLEAVIVSSFDPRTLEVVAQCVPQVRRALLTDERLSASACLAETVARGHHLCHPHAAALLAEPDLPARAAARGVRVRTWTVNRPAAALTLAERGVDAVITDRPRELLSALAARPAPARLLTKRHMTSTERGNLRYLTSERAGHPESVRPDEAG